MKSFLIKIGVLLTVICFFSCKKEKAESQPSNTELLIASPWLHTSTLLVSNGVAKDHPYNKADNCLRDNEFVFSKDQSYRFTEGNTRCVIANPTVLDEGNWSLENYDNILRFKSSMHAFPYDREIVRLTRDSLYLQVKSGISVITEIYTHK